MKASMYEGFPVPHLNEGDDIPIRSWYTMGKNMYTALINSRHVGLDVQYDISMYVIELMYRIWFFWYWMGVWYHIGKDMVHCGVYDIFCIRGSYSMRMVWYIDCLPMLFVYVVFDKVFDGSGA